MEENLVKTNVKYPEYVFDKYHKTFTPSSDSFDFIHHLSLPSFFVSFVKKTTEVTSEQRIQTNFIGEHLSHFHSQIIQLLMIFGLSFSETDYINFDKLMNHKEILEQELYIITNKSSFDFISNFSETISLLEKSCRSAIFLFNTSTGIDIYAVDNGFLSKAPIIIVYSKEKAKILFPKDFYFFTRNINEKEFFPSDVKQKLLVLIYYSLIEDHWVPNYDKTDLKLIVSSLLQQPTREDNLSFNFQSFLTNDEMKFIGYIGHNKDVFHYFKRKHFNLERPKTQNGSPKIYFYKYDDKTVFLIYWIPDRSTFIDLSPSSDLFSEATMHAYQWMKSFCSNVILIPNSGLQDSSIIKLSSEQEMMYKTRIEIEKEKENKFQKFVEQQQNFLNNLRKGVVGVKPTQNSFDRYFFGTLDTLSYVVIKKSETENYIRFKSLQHLIHWIEWNSRSRTICFELDEWNIKDSSILIDGISIQLNNSPINRFNHRTNHKISCIISNEIFAFIRKHTIRNIHQKKNQKNDPNKSILISKLVAFEDGTISINLKTDVSSLTSHKSYTIYKLCESTTKGLMPTYVIKYVKLHHIEGNFTLLHSWIVDNNILVLFYSELEEKIMLIRFKKGYNDRTPPYPIFEVKSKFNDMKTNPYYRDQDNPGLFHDNYKYFASFCSISRIMLFTIYEYHELKIVSIVVNHDFTGISNFKSQRLDAFIPLENLYKNPQEPIFPYFGGFLLNENGSDAAMYFKCFCQLSSGDMSSQHFIVLFDPSNLVPIRTVRYTLGKDVLQNFSLENKKHSIHFPYLYMNHRILFIDRSKYCNDFVYYVLLYNLENPDDIRESSYGIPHNTITKQNIVAYHDDPLTMRCFGFWKFSGIPVMTQIKQESISIETTLYDKVLYQQKQKFLLTLPMVFNDNHTFLPNNFDNFILPFSFNMISQLIIQTGANYGYSLSDQIVFPEPKTIPLHFREVTILSEYYHDDELHVVSDDELISLVEAIEATGCVYLFSFIKEDISISDIPFMYNSKSFFINHLFTTPQTVVHQPIVDSVTITEKQTSNLCYNIRANNFPQFVFLRMTTTCKCFHISAIGENIHSLLSSITGIPFSYIPINSLSIGSHPIPKIKERYNILDGKKGIKPECISGLINVIGSLFNTIQSSFAQVVAFICAISSSHTIILKISNATKIIEFFRKLIDCADLLCEEFELDLNSKRKVNVAIFCDLGNNAKQMQNHISNEIERIISERELDKDSYLSLIFKISNFFYFHQTESSIENAKILFNHNILNITESNTFTDEVLPSIQRMAFIFGQQVDHEANNEAKPYIPFVKHDEDNGYCELLFNLGESLHSEVDQTRNSKSQTILEVAAKCGSDKAIYLLGATYRKDSYTQLSADNQDTNTLMSLYIEAKEEAEYVNNQTNSLPKDQIANLIKCANKGNIVALFEYGKHLYNNGKYEKAFDYFSQFLNRKNEELDIFAQGLVLRYNLDTITKHTGKENREEIDEKCDIFTHELSNPEKRKEIMKFLSNYFMNEHFHEAFNFIYEIFHQPQIRETLCIKYPKHTNAIILELLSDSTADNYSEKRHLAFNLFKMIPEERQDLEVNLRILHCYFDE
ncbi:hypothetical protein TRFO_19179 [Tritrichomonas foetus]|uniref:Uncharacterized protein n=1 Tax=Tritrichomonas foetus TaxID=1144522 RepID=A0A1J4KPM5_9EUKA|nr:hypothetical protein TRFO_19179 [Tritrichomonas foetus]|eukprot:OHT11373.1 hypothetical protein TRFO_19179 [Tritrichomonas foetus]